MRFVSFAREADDKGTVGQTERQTVGQTERTPRSPAAKYKIIRAVITRGRREKKKPGRADQTRPGQTIEKTPRKTERELRYDNRRILQ